MYLCHWTFFTDDNATLNGDEVEEIPFHETKFYVPSSYSAGPNPERSSLTKISSGNMSAVNALVIIFSILLSISLVVALSWLLWRSHKQQLLNSLSWTQHFFRMNQRNGENIQGGKVWIDLFVSKLVKSKSKILKFPYR